MHMWLSGQIIFSPFLEEKYFSPLVRVMHPAREMPRNPNGPSIPFLAGGVFAATVSEKKKKRLQRHRHIVPTCLVVGQVGPSVVAGTFLSSQLHCSARLNY